MNLQEALDYRRICPFCQQYTKIGVAGCPGLRVYSDKKGIRIQSILLKKKLVSFNHDGSYGRTKRTYPIHKDPIQIVAYCNRCPCKPVPLIKPGLIGISTYQYSSSIDNLMETGSAFTFNLFGDTLLGYDLQPQIDVIRYFDGNSFYHWTSDFVKGTTILQRAKFSDSLENLMTLHLPLSKLPDLRSKDSFLKKYNLYTLFS